MNFSLKLCPLISDTVVFNFSVFLIAQDKTVDTDCKTDHFSKSIIEMLFKQVIKKNLLFYT